MLNLNEYELRDEEQRGNFTPGTPDDETFYLESLQEYPSELPDYSQLDEEAKISLEEQLDLAESQPKQPQITINETETDETIKQIPEQKLDEITEIEQQETPENIQESIETETPEQNIDFAQTSETEQTEQQQTLDDIPDSESLTSTVLEETVKETNLNGEKLKEDQSVWNLFEVNDVETKPKKALIDVDDEEFLKEQEHKKETEQITKESEEEVTEIDEDLKYKLQQELEKSKIKEKRDKPEDTIIHENDQQFQEFASESIEEIDLSKINAEHPSTYRDEETTQKEQIKDISEEPIPEIKPEPPKQKTTPVQKTEKKKKGIFYYVAATLFIIILAGLIYDWGVNRYAFNDIYSLLFGTKKDTTKIAELETKQLIHKDTVPKIKETEHTEKLIKPKTIEPTKKITDTLKTQTEIKKPEQIASIEPKPHKIKEKITQPQVTKHSKDNYPGIKFFAEDKSNSIPNELPPRPHNQNNKGAIYTIQVYATPSKEDADYWVEKLKKKNIKNVIVSTYIKKGVQWYRVRFGEFSSYELALQKANELNLYQCWIDRIK